jgi:hypothetical protein
MRGLLLRGAPQSVGSAPKSECEQGNKDGGYRRNGPVVGVEKCANLSNPVAEQAEKVRHFISGLLFVVGVIAALIAAVVVRRRNSPRRDTID